jgi:hypothetical protein
MHTIQEDFDHFLSYSGNSFETENIKRELFKAYEANWDEVNNAIVQLSVFLEAIGVEPVGNLAGIVIQIDNVFVVPMLTSRSTWLAANPAPAQTAAPVSEDCN